MLGSSAGIFKLLLGGATILNPFQVVLDYVAAKGIIGASGFFKDKKHGLIIGGFVGILGRYIVAVISGYIFFAEYVPADFQHSALVWSLYYNITSARALAEATGATVLLKATPTLVVGPGPAPALSVDPGPGWLATAGSGDVLAGILGALLAARGARREGGGPPAEPANPSKPSEPES